MAAEGERNFAINGAGQIGTGILRINAERAARGESHLPITTIVDDYLSRDDIIGIMRGDKVYGPPGVDLVAEGDNGIRIGNQRVEACHAAPDHIINLGYRDVWGVFEATGNRVKGDRAEEHITVGGAKKVLITAPSKGTLADGTPVKSLVMGYNEEDYDPDKDHVVDNASCTTKSAVPIVYALEDAVGVDVVLLETIHALTGQARRELIANLGRVEAIDRLGFIPAPTGAQGALKKLFPELSAVLAEAYRVPTPDGSVSDITMVLKKALTVDEIRAVLREFVLDRVLQVVDKIENSADLIGNPHDSVAQIGDGKIKVSGNVVRVPVGYDNGYAPADAALHLMEHMDAQAG